MTEDNKTTVEEVTSSRGAQWAGAGSLIALAAQSLFGGGNGGGGLLNGVLGGRSGGQDMAVTALMTENARLKADADTNAKIADVYTRLREQDKLQDATVASLEKRITQVEMAATNGISTLASAVANVQSTLSGITKTVVPNTSVCPGWGDVTITPATSTTTTT
jgi:hypothetical protein